MGIFDPSLEKIKGMYHRAWIESGRGAVNPREYEYLNKELLRYAKENNCTYDEAFRRAKSL